MKIFSLQRFFAMLIKEFIQMRRDKVTIGILVIIPLIQLVLFGFAINVNPRNLPTVIVSADHTNFTRQFITALQNTKYFTIANGNATKSEAGLLLTRGDAQFVINIPANFTRNLIAGKKPALLVTLGASDPSSIGEATVAIKELTNQVFNSQYQHGLAHLQSSKPAFGLIVHNKYNPESIAQYNIIPGLAGVILTMTLVMATAMAITKDRGSGTIESLLAAPVRPFEVVLGKIAPYILVGYFQLILILLSSFLLFHVPFAGSITLLLITTFPFILANLAMGLTFSTLAENQLQAMQVSFFFFLPSILLSGFMFPFYGMPVWAQFIGNLLPMTHYIHIVRSVALKGSGLFDIWPDSWPLLLFIVIAGVICIKRCRQTLD